jgi:hypothetical protein
VGRGGAACPPLPSPAPPAPDGGVEVFPGMEIRQGTTVCTLGYVDPVTRTGYSAGHCRGSGTVTDRDGRYIGVVAAARDNTPSGAVVRTDQVISDYETITLARDVTVRTALPGGRQLVVDPGLVLAPGQTICHYGAVTRESCGTVERINNGWFTMHNGVVSQKGDSGGPSTPWPATAPPSSPACSTAPGVSCPPRCPGRPPASSFERIPVPRSWMWPRRTRTVRPGISSAGEWARHSRDRRRFGGARILR